MARALSDVLSPAYTFLEDVFHELFLDLFAKRRVCLFLPDDSVLWFPFTMDGLYQTHVNLLSIVYYIERFAVSSEAHRKASPTIVSNFDPMFHTARWE
jgi:hypothetical protein